MMIVPGFVADHRLVLRARHADHLHRLHRSWRLLLAPLIFTVCFLIALRRYMRKLNRSPAQQRMQFGMMNAVLTESVTGIEVVKSTAQEAQERAKFLTAARAFRDAAVKQGRIEAGYLPTLLLGFAIAGARPASGCI